MIFYKAALYGRRRVPAHGEIKMDGRTAALELSNAADRAFAEAVSDQILAKRRLSKAVLEVDEATAKVKKTKTEQEQAREAVGIAMGKRRGPRERVLVVDLGSGGGD